jgi:hypothetical protein
MPPPSSGPKALPYMYMLRSSDRCSRLRPDDSNKAARKAFQAAGAHYSLLTALSAGVLRGPRIVSCTLGDCVVVAVEA